MSKELSSGVDPTLKRKKSTQFTEPTKSVTTKKKKFITGQNTEIRNKGVNFWAVKDLLE